MDRATLLSLDTALLDRIIEQLVKWGSVRAAVAQTCLINKRFALLARQPLQSWKRLDLGRLRGENNLSSQALASLALWASAVAPSVKSLTAAPLFGDSALGQGYQHLVLGCLLPNTKTLQDLSAIYLEPADLPTIGLLTSLRTLSCQCSLPDGLEPLSSLSSLQHLWRLHIEILHAVPGGQLPASLSALTGLDDLEVTSRRNRILEPQPYLRLPWAWCQAANRVTVARLQGVDLPKVPQQHCSDGSAILPALYSLQLSQPMAFFCDTALGRCQRLKRLTVDGGIFVAPDWSALAMLTRLQHLELTACHAADEVNGHASLRALSTLTALTSLHISLGSIPAAITHLPAVCELYLGSLESDEWEPGWALPGGPWLRQLRELRMLAGDVGSIEAVLREATQLHSMELEGCAWLQFTEAEGPLLLRLPLTNVYIDKRPEEATSSVPSPLWGEESLRVAQAVLSAVQERGQGGSFTIVTKEGDLESAED